jgi:hypothetical protein
MYDAEDEYLTITKRWILEYISFNETLSFVGPMRDKIFFDESEKLKNILLDARLSLKVLLNSIGYSSLAFNWASLRQHSGAPIQNTREAWGSLYRKYEEDTQAQDYHVPRVLNDHQQRAIQSIFDHYETQLHLLAHPQRLTLVGTVLPSGGEPHLARLGMGGSNHTGKESPLYKLMSDSRDPHLLWQSRGEENHLIVAAVPKPFGQPFVNWSHARGGRVYVHKEPARGNPIKELARMQSLPVEEYLSLIAVPHARAEDMQDSLIGVLKFIARS